MKAHTWTISLLVLMLLSLPPLLATRAGAAEGAEEGKGKRVVAKVGEDGVQRLEVLSGEYYFEPNHIVVQVDKPVELLVRKVDGFVPHNIIVQAPAAGIDFKVDVDDEIRPIRFTPTKTGRYEMYCDKSFLWFESHREKGMEGIIEVVE
jgi:plastocyanin